MSGLISKQPSQSAIRLAVAASLLLLIQSGLLLLLPSLGASARTLILVLSPISVLAFGTALIGVPDPSPHRWRARHDG